MIDPLQLTNLQTVGQLILKFCNEINFWRYVFIKYTKQM